MKKEAETVRDLIESLAEFGSREAIIAFRKDGPQVLTFAELDKSVRKTAGGLVRHGYGKNTIIAVSAANSPEWIVLALAVLSAGCILLPVDPQADDETLSHIIQDSGVEVLFTDTDLEKKFNRLQNSGLKKIYFLNKEEGKKSWQQFAGRKIEEPGRIDPDDRAALFYTSGTTGPPKGVPLTHANLACQPEAVRLAEVISADERVFLPLPLHHVYPFVIGMLTPITLGVPVILPYSLTGGEVIRAVDEGRASIIIGVPRLYRTLYEGIRGRITDRGITARLVFSTMLSCSSALRNHFGFSAGRYLFSFIHKQFGGSLRILASGGSALDSELAEHLEGLGWHVAIGYGITETSPLLTIHPPGAGMLKSVGKAVRGVELKIDPEAESSHKEDPENGGKVTGEVLARGPNIFHGYHNQPEKTKKAFTEDGWFRTGDLGHLDDDGYLYLHGREKTLIITESGKNIQPDEVEKVYGEHPAISEIGIFGNEGQLVAVIVPDRKNIKEGGTPVETIVRDAVDQQSEGLPTHKTLSEYVISHESLARTRLGKIRRHMLEEKYFQIKSGEHETAGQKGPVPVARMSDQDQALLEDKTARQVWDMLAKKYKDMRLAPDSSPRFDLGIDSLEWLDLSLHIQQQTGVEMSEEVIGRIGTIRDLLEEVSSLPESEESVDTELLLQEPESVLDEERKQWLKPKGRGLSAMAYLFYQLNRGIMKSWFRLVVEGRENLPADAPFLITPNHVSLLDPFVLAAAIPYETLQKSYYAGWKMLAFRNVLFRFVSRLAQAIPIDARHAVSSSLALSAAVLKRGNNLILFPEGERSTDGRLQEFKVGVSLLLEHYDVPVVPVYINGTYEALPKGSFFPRPRKITVNFGKPLMKKELLNGLPKDKDRKDHIRDRLRQELISISDRET